MPQNNKDLDKLVTSGTAFVIALTTNFLLALVYLLIKRRKGEVVEKDAASRANTILSTYAKKLESKVNSSWGDGIAFGNEAARLDAVALKEKHKPHTPSNTTLRKLLSDADKIVKDANQHLTDAINKDNSSEVSRVEKNIKLRSMYLIEAAIRMGAAETYHGAMTSTNTRKMWVATSTTPCSHCTRLNGMVKEWHETFPESFAGISPLNTYKALYGPPRHPNCRCKIVAVPK